MNRTDATIRMLLEALPSNGYDLGILSAGRMQRLEAVAEHRLLGMLPYLKHRNANGAHIYLRPAGESAYTLLDDLSSASLLRMNEEGFTPAAVIETSYGNYQAWLRHALPFSKELGTIAAKMLATRFRADTSAADWRRFGRAPGFTNRKPQYRDGRGLYPFATLRCAAGTTIVASDAFRTTVVAAETQQKNAALERKRAFETRRVSFAPTLSLLTFRDAERYQGRPAAADLAFSVCAVARGWNEEDIADALRANYLSRDTNSHRQNAYIRRTISKAIVRLS